MLETPTEDGVTLCKIIKSNTTSHDTHTHTKKNKIKDNQINWFSPLKRK